MLITFELENNTLINSSGMTANQLTQILNELIELGYIYHTFKTSGTIKLDNFYIELDYFNYSSENDEVGENFIETYQRSLFTF